MPPTMTDTRALSRTVTSSGSDWNADQYNKTASFVYSNAFVAPILELLDPRPGERILDLGCGSGEVTVEISRVVEQKKGGVIVGVDFSESMVSERSFSCLWHPNTVG